MVQTSSRSEVKAKSYGCPKSQESKLGQFRDSTLGVPGQKAIRISLRGRTQRILYGGRWRFPSSPGRGESSESKCPWLLPTPKGVLGCELTLLWLVLNADSCEIIIVPLPSLIPGLLAHPSYPLLVLEVGSGLQVPTFRNSTYLNPQVGLIRNLGARHYPSSKPSDPLMVNLQTPFQVKTPSPPANVANILLIET